MSFKKNYIVTGANSGLGWDTSRQLGLLPSTNKVYMACRTEHKAMKAIDELVQYHGVPRSKVAFIKFDGSSSKETISHITDELPSGEIIDGLILNAGGLGHDASGKAVGPNKVVGMFQINLIGHIHLIDCLQENGYLVDGSRIVFSSSEAARGVPQMSFPPPKMKDELSFYDKALHGKLKKRFDSKITYAYCKGFGNLYFAAWARKNPGITVLSVSPGGTKDTNAASAKAMPIVFRKMMTFMVPLMERFGLFHPLEVGAKRYVDAVLGIDEFKEFSSGDYIASVKGTTGGVGNQIYHKHGKQYGDIRKQDLCYNAIRSVA